MNPALIVAKLDLQLVRMIRQAIRTADAASGKGGGSPAAVIAPRPQIHPTPHFQPRPVIHPTPRIEPRLVYRPKTIEPRLAPGISSLPPEAPRERSAHKLPIEPPWKVMPWQSPAPAAPAAPKLKPVDKHPDVANKGTLLDVFI